MQVTSLYLHLNQLNQATTPPTPRYLFLLQILTTEWRWSLTTPFFSTKPITKLLLPLWGGNLPWGDLHWQLRGFVFTLLLLFGTLITRKRFRLRNQLGSLKASLPRWIEQLFLEVAQWLKGYWGL